MRFFKHPRMTDIAFEVIKSYYIPEKESYKIKVLFLLRLPCTDNDYEYMNFSDTLLVPKAKRKEWVAIEPNFPNGAE